MALLLVLLTWVFCIVIGELIKRWKIKNGSLK
jgi:hypothetical protein